MNDQPVARIAAELLSPPATAVSEPAADRRVPVQKVAVIIDYHHHYRTEFFRFLAERLNLEVLFVSPTGEDRKGLNNRTPPGLKHRILTRNRYEDVLRRPLLAMRALLGASAILLRGRYPIIVIHGYSNPACYAAFLSKLLCRSQIIMWGESNLHDKKRHALLEGFKSMVLHGCDQVHVYGRSARDYFIRLGVDAQRIYITQPTIDERHFANLQARTGKKERIEVLYLGRFSPEKNLFRLVESIDLYRKRHPETRIRLTLVGFGELEAKLRLQIAGSCLEGIVRIRGQVQP